MFDDNYSRYWPEQMLAFLGVAFVAVLVAFVCSHKGWGRACRSILFSVLGGAVGLGTVIAVHEVNYGAFRMFEQRLPTGLAPGLHRSVNLIGHWAPLLGVALGAGLSIFFAYRDYAKSPPNHELQ